MLPLQEELLAVPGIAGAEVDEDGGVAGVRVQLAEGANAETIGVEVRRILVEHGMRPTVGDDDHGGLGPPPPPGAPGSVVSFPLVGEHAAVVQQESPVRGLESVAVEETPDGVAVLVRSTTGTRSTRALGSGGSGLDEAVVAAVAELTEHRNVELVGCDESKIAGHTVVVVLLAIDDRRVTGSAVQRAGRAYAMAHAAWSALDQI